MIKWIKLIRFIKKMRREHNHYAFELLTTSNEIIVIMRGER